MNTIKITPIDFIKINTHMHGITKCIESIEDVIPGKRYSEKELFEKLIQFEELTKLQHKLIEDCFTELEKQATIVAALVKQLGVENKYVSAITPP